MIFRFQKRGVQTAESFKALRFWNMHGKAPVGEKHGVRGEPRLPQRRGRPFGERGERVQMRADERDESARACHGGETAFVRRQRQRADEGAGRGNKSREHRERDGKAPRERRAALVQHLRAERGEPEHFLTVHGAQPPRLRNEPGIGGEYALHVGIDAALVRAQRRGRGYGGRVRAAAPEL